MCRARAAVVFGCALLVASAALPARSREVCDPADASFAGAVAIDLGAAGRPLNELTGLPLGPGEQIYQFTAAGVTFRFQSLSTRALEGGSGLLSFGSGDGRGIALAASPPVSAIGVRGFELDGCPAALFVGTAASQPASAIGCTGPPCSARPTSPVFFGAADIGDVGTADLARPASVFVVTQLVFVPPAVGPADEADLAISKTEAGGLTHLGSGVPFAYRIDVGNAGPDPAGDVFVVDLLPHRVFDRAAASGLGTLLFDGVTDVLSLLEPALASQGSLRIDVEATTPERRAFTCESTLVNVAQVTSAARDPDLRDNLSLHTLRFDRAAVAAVVEHCSDGIDNDCDGLLDCDDDPCSCRASLAPLPGGLENPLCSGVIGSGLVRDERGDIRYCGPAPDHGCTVPRGECGGVTVPAACCDVNLFSNPNAILNLDACDVGVPGCVPRDPNFKESIPGVTIEGYGYTQAGQRMTYILHYENVGDADAHDVRVIDVLDEDLDAATLTVHDGGVYDAATRTLVWTDPVVPPATPRQVGFEIDVRGDAAPGTRVRNVGTIVFPDAVPPSRIDTNFVEHVVPEPSRVIAPRLSVLGCSETAPGSGRYRVELGNAGDGFAYNVRAQILDPPAAVAVSDGEARFSHPDDPADGSFTSVIPAAITTSADDVAFSTRTPGDPCAALVWRIAWDDLAGGAFSAVAQEAPDADADAVADAADNCPDAANPEQQDRDGDGAGDACDEPAPACDVDGDRDVDAVDVNAIFAARGAYASGPGDPRDANRDGRITINDARQCALACTLPECASPQPPACGLLGAEPLLLLGLMRLRPRRLAPRAGAEGGAR